MALPVVENPGQILARDACHGSKIVLPDLLTDDDPTGRDLLPEMIRQLQHRSRDPALKRKEATGCYHGVRLAQPMSVAVGLKSFEHAQQRIAEQREEEGRQQAAAASTTLMATGLTMMQNANPPQPPDGDHVCVSDIPGTARFYRC